MRDLKHVRPHLTERNSHTLKRRTSNTVNRHLTLDREDDRKSLKRDKETKSGRTSTTHPFTFSHSPIYTYQTGVLQQLGGAAALRRLIHIEGNGVGSHC